MPRLPGAPVRGVFKLARQDKPLVERIAQAAYAMEEEARALRVLVHDQLKNSPHIARPAYVIEKAARALRAAFGRDYYRLRALAPGGGLRLRRAFARCSDIALKWAGRIIMPPRIYAALSLARASTRLSG